MFVQEIHREARAKDDFPVLSASRTARRATGSVRSRHRRATRVRRRATAAAAGFSDGLRRAQDFGRVDWLGNVIERAGLERAEFLRWSSTAVMKITGTSRQSGRSLRRRQVATPSKPGITISINTKSGGRMFKSNRALRPLSATRSWYPTSVSESRSRERLAGVSSTTRTRFWPAISGSGPWGQCSVG